MIPLTGAAPDDATGDALAITPAPTTSREVRQQIVEALRLDLVGPWPGHEQERERLYFRDRPANFYLTGFLIPESARAPKQVAASTKGPDREQGLTIGFGADGDLDGNEAGGSPYTEEAQAEPVPWKPRLRPASMGLSVLVPPEAAAPGATLTVTVRWGDYHKADVPEEDLAHAQSTVPGSVPGPEDASRTASPRGKARRAPDAEDLGVDTAELPDPPEETDTGPKCWQRTPRTGRVVVPLDDLDPGDPRAWTVPASLGLEIKVVCQTVSEADAAAGLPLGTRSVSIFLTNRRAFTRDQWIDEVSVFQAELEVQSSIALLPRPDLKGARSSKWDDKVNALHYADTHEFATGHGVSADWVTSTGGDEPAGTCHTVRTTWLPGASVPRVEPGRIDGVTIDMRALASLADGDAVRAALGALPSEYLAWIQRQEEASGADGTLDDEKRLTATMVLEEARACAGRIAGGISVLARDPVALAAFRVANQAVADALVQVKVNDPAWRPFQLAFILLNLEGMTDRTHASRKVVDLLFFPTGGGKTEAYLGLSAYAMVLRRLRNPGHSGHDGAGVTVLMRYSLRLLTLDQLARATRLVCALELIRRTDIDTYGHWPFEIGLWVGGSSTPNRLGQSPGDVGEETAIGKLVRFQSRPASSPRPVPLEECPWCGEPLGPESFSITPNRNAPLTLALCCTRLGCSFTGASGGLPIVAIDEAIYRRLPAFIVATLDKFANLPWVGPSGALLGGADRYDRTGFYGPSEMGQGSLLGAPLLPPELIIQDELHLVGGPLGTMAGLYETAIEGLCLREEQGVVVRPKIVASTATVRQARDQVQALFGRSKTSIFPPPGPARVDSFFARTIAPTDATPGRDYLGVAAPAGNAKAAMRRVWLAVLGAGLLAYRNAKVAASEAGTPHGNGENPADPYLTILGYFNSLRELGGARRVIEEEVQNTVRRYGSRRRRTERQSMFLSRRYMKSVVELTSRVSTAEVATARRRLGVAWEEPDHVDVAIATNMISVGLDIQRLGLMVVHGQPILTAEYIQSTSRVGRAADKPGLVITILNPNKPRDRSHYERFRHFHETFYRSVEPVSVTPFASRALDRGLAGALVAAMRHGNPGLAAAGAVNRMPGTRSADEARVIKLFVDRVGVQVFANDQALEARSQSVRDRIGSLLDSWASVITQFQFAKLRYQRHEKDSPPGTQPLLRDMLDREIETAQQARFRAGRSLRDVEPQLELAVRNLTGDLAPQEDE